MSVAAFFYWSIMDIVGHQRLLPICNGDLSLSLSSQTKVEPPLTLQVMRLFV